MKISDGSVTLTELAKELGVGSATLRQHLYKNKGGIADNANKFMGRKTGDFLLDVHSVLTFVEWARGKSRKMTEENLNRVETEIRAWLADH
jgi:phage antirepressor YoqD-like protein